MELAAWWRRQQEMISPYKDGNPLSPRVSKIRQGNNPHAHTLAEAVVIARKQINGKTSPPRTRPK